MQNTPATLLNSPVTNPVGSANAANGVAIPAQESAELFQKVSDAFKTNDPDEIMPVCVEANLFYLRVSANQPLQPEQYKQWVQCMVFIVENRIRLVVSTEADDCAEQCMQLLEDQTIFQDAKKEPQDYRHLYKVKIALANNMLDIDPNRKVELQIGALKILTSDLADNLEKNEGKVITDLRNALTPPGLKCLCRCNANKN